MMLFLILNRSLQLAYKIVIKCFLMLSTNFKKVMHTFQVMFLLRKAPLCGSLELKNVSEIMRTFLSWEKLFGVVINIRKVAKVQYMGN